MNEPAQQSKPTAAAKPTGERVPIPIEKLFFTAANPHGVKLPDGPEGKGEKIHPHLIAGEHGDVKTEIMHMPWMRVFRVVKLKKVTRSGAGKDAKEVTTWAPMGKPFNIPDTWAVAVPAEE